MPKIVGVMVVGPGEAKRGRLWFAIDSLRQVTDEVLVALNFADDDTRNMVKGQSCVCYRDDREWGTSQAAIKERLHEMARKRGADWIIALDADERFARGFDRAQLEALTTQGPSCWNFYLVDLWNDTEHYRPEMSFWRPHFYRAVGPNAFDRNRFDPSLVPEWAASHAASAPHVVIHYGLIRREDRLRRVERYARYDPTGARMAVSYRQQLAEDVPGVPFDEEALAAEVAREVRSWGKPPAYTPMADAEKRYIYVRRKADGVTLTLNLWEWEDIKRDKNRAALFDPIGEVTAPASAVAALPPIVEEEPPAPPAEQHADPVPPQRRRKKAQ